MATNGSLTDDQLTIAQAAERTGLTAHTLRYYERARLLLRVDRDGSSGHRRYGERDIEWITLCTKLRATGMPIRRIREYADLVRAGEGNEGARIEILEAHRAEVVEQLAELERNLELIDYKLGLYRDKVTCDAENALAATNGQAPVTSR
jgi:DNA-binding transcriptional MerR regulator